MKRAKGEPPKNTSASVKARLLSLAREQSEDFNALLTRYVLERFLHRLASSNHASSFVLKGATLFAVWSKRPHRTTRDIDLLGYGNPDLARLEAVQVTRAGPETASYLHAFLVSSAQPRNLRANTSTNHAVHFVEPMNSE